MIFLIRILRVVKYRKISNLEGMIVYLWINVLFKVLSYEQ